MTRNQVESILFIKLFVLPFAGTHCVYPRSDEGVARLSFINNNITKWWQVKSFILVSTDVLVAIYSIGFLKVK